MASTPRGNTTMHVQMESPFKFIMSPSHSAPDMTVQGLVDRFTGLEVKDKDEEKTQRTMRRLEAALRRAEMAREEAETEASRWKKELREQREVDEEKARERSVLRERLEEFEKKYDKAKDRFRQQKVKHEDQLRKTSKEYMEREKLHWRQQQQLQEEVEWERKLRAEANDLISFLEIERLVAVQTQRDLDMALMSRLSRPTPLPEVRVGEHSPEATPNPAPVEPEAPNTAPVEQTDEQMQEAEQQDEIDNSHTLTQADDMMDTCEPSSTTTTTTTTNYTEPNTQPIRTSSPLPPTTINPPLQPSTSIPLLIPVDFGDDFSSDKENNAPRTPSRHVSAPPTGYKTPMTVSCSTPGGSHLSRPDFSDLLKTPIDREAALKAIEYRRGRARSVGKGIAMATPKGGKGRDASAPPLVMHNHTMSVGRKSRT